MNYIKSVEYVENAVLFGSKKDGIQNITRLLSRLGNPHHEFKSIHVAGTNGKGSTCLIINSILCEAGLKTGLFTSPYLQKFTERMTINGKQIEEEVFAEIATEVRGEADKIHEDGYNYPTFFELVTAIGFCYFAKEKVDFAVVEVGIGGRLDSTNTLDPELTVITSIGLDHMRILGNSIESIAAEKAGIIKPGCPVVVYPQPESESFAVILNIAKNQFAPIYSVADSRVQITSASMSCQIFDFKYQGMELEDLRINMMGTHQVLNSATAIVSIMVLAQTLGISISSNNIYDGLLKAKWPGRLEVISKEPLIILDGAHNAQGANALRRTLNRFLPLGDNILLTGVLGSKDSKEIADILSTICSQVIITSPSDRKSSDPIEFATHFTANNLPITVEDDRDMALKLACDLAKASKKPLIIAGSLYLVGYARTYFMIQ